MLFLLSIPNNTKTVTKKSLVSQGAVKVTPIATNKQTAGKTISKKHARVTRLSQTITKVVVFQGLLPNYSSRNVSILNFVHHNLLQLPYRSKISEPLDVFPMQSQRIGVLNLTRLRLRGHANANVLVKLISRSRFKTILHNKRLKQSRLFCHIRLCISTASGYSRKQALSKDLFLIKKNTN